MQISGGSMELEPWIVVSNHGGENSIQLWAIAGTEQQAFAIFSNESGAQEYADAIGLSEYQLLQLDQSKLLKTMIDCYRNKIEFAALNPTQQKTSKLFKIKDVLAAAKDQLERARDSQ